jgi:hypothetical protein
MIFKLTLYQNGDMVISRHEETYLDAEEVLYSRNYYEELNHSDRARQVNMYKKFQDVVNNLDKLCRMTGRERPDDTKVRGNVIKEMEFMMYTPDSFATDGRSDGLDRKQLEQHLNEITGRLICEIQDLKKELNTTLEEIKF